ncbi:MAG: transporter substrate-binding domain-containing protein [Minisyncoccales bacterium]
MEKKEQGLVILVVIAMLALIALSLLYISIENVPIQEKYTVVASGHTSWWPTMGRIGMTEAGIGVDAAEIVCDDIGFNFNPIYAGSWSEVQEKLKTGELDLVVAMYKTEDREKYYDFSIAYTKDPITPFVAKGKTFSPQKENLIGKKGVVTRGDSYGPELDKYIVEANLDIAVVDTAEEGFALVEEGRADYLLYSTYAGETIIAKERISGIEESGTISEQPFYMAVSKKSPLAKHMNEINASLRRQMNDQNSSLNKVLLK